MCLQSMSLFFVSTSIVVECAFSQCYVFVSTTLLAVGLTTHSTHQSTNSYLSQNTNHHNEITPVAQSPCYNRENEPSSRRGKPFKMVLSTSSSVSARHGNRYF